VCTLSFTMRAPSLGGQCHCGHGGHVTTYNLHPPIRRWLLLLLRLLTCSCHGAVTLSHPSHPSQASAPVHPPSSRTLLLLLLRCSCPVSWCSHPQPSFIPQPSTGPGLVHPHQAHSPCCCCCCAAPVPCHGVVTLNHPSYPSQAPAPASSIRTKLTHPVVAAAALLLSRVMV
jgi:hypothetical protein